MPEEQIQIMIVAGEASGDAHAARLVHAINDLRPEQKVVFFGSAGPQMRRAGVEPTVGADAFSVIGLPEIAKALPMFWNAFTKLKAAARTRRPSVAVLVDFPEFNLRLAKALSKEGIKVVYYISPQLWAWRQYRISTISRYVDLLISILPFEKAWYAERGVHKVEYVGNPLTAEVSAEKSPKEFCAVNDLDPGRPLIALLPGSRHKEVAKILPEMLAAAVQIEAERPDAQFAVAAATEKRSDEIRQLIGEAKEKPATLKVVLDQTYDLLNASDVAAVASGTATLETGIIGTPMAIVYKGTKLNYKILRPLITVEHFGLVNLIAEYRLAKELIQDDLTPAALAAEMLRLLEGQVNAEMRRELKLVRDKLGSGGASQKAAELVLKIAES